MQVIEFESGKTYCQFCETEIEQSQNGSKKIFCTKNCSKKYHRQKRKHEAPLTKINCRVCGVDVLQKQRSNPKLYCSIRCKGIYQRQTHPKDKTKVKGNCKVCGAAFTLPMRKYCSAECRKKHAWQNSCENGKFIHVCPYCSRGFKSYRKQRTYCSQICSGLAQRLVNPPNRYGELKSGTIEPSEVIASNSPRFEALRLFREGYSVKAISQALRLPAIRVQKWCQRLQSLNSTSNANEWREVFRFHAAKLIPTDFESDEIVHLVCTRMDVRYNAYQLGEIVSESLKVDSCNGEKYAFCSKGNTIITIIQFDGKSFVSTSRHRFSGQYVWPEEHFGGLVTITGAEFNLIYNEEIHRVSGAPKFKKV